MPRRSAASSVPTSTGTEAFLGVEASMDIRPDRDRRRPSDPAAASLIVSPPAIGGTAATDPPVDLVERPSPRLMADMTWDRSSGSSARPLETGAAAKCSDLAPSGRSGSHRGPIREARWGSTGASVNAERSTVAGIPFFGIPGPREFSAWANCWSDSSPFPGIPIRRGFSTGASPPGELVSVESGMLATIRLRLRSADPGRDVSIAARSEAMATGGAAAPLKLGR
jgi:hypothetical protein